MIESARFTSVNGAVVDFNTDTSPWNSFTTEVDIRFTEKARSQRHGIYPADTYMGKRSFHAEGAIMASNSAEYWQKRLNMVNALLPRPQYGQKVSGTLELLLTGFAEKVYADCVITGWPELPLEGLSPSVGRYQVNFQSFDPRLYGELQSLDIAYNPSWENFGGRTYNKTYNKSWSTPATTPGQQNISNIGNVEVFPTVTFYGPATNPRAIMIRNDGSIFRFALIGVVLTGVTDSAIIDMENRTVTRSDGSNLYQYAVGSDWLKLEPYPNTNVITFGADSLSSPAHMSVQWRNGYMI